MIGRGMLNSMIPQLWQRLGSVHDDALQDAMAEYVGSYSDKHMKANELMMLQL